MKAVLTGEDNVRQTVSEISSLCKNDDNKVHCGEMEPESVQKNPLLKEAYGLLTLRNGWFDESLRMTP